MAKIGFRKGAKMERFEKGLENPKAALTAIGVMMVAESQDAFQQQRHGSVEWPARSNPNVYGILADFAAGKSAPPARRFQDRPALIDTGRLRSSIAFRVSGKSVTVGTDLEYAQVLNSGGSIESVTITGEVRQRLWSWLKTQGTERQKQLGWLMNRKFKGETLQGKVEPRPFIGITDTLTKDVADLIGVEIFESNK